MVYKAWIADAAVEKVKIDVKLLKLQTKARIQEAKLRYKEQKLAAEIGMPHLGLQFGYTQSNTAVHPYTAAIANGVQFPGHHHSHSYHAPLSSISAFECMLPVLNGPSTSKHDTSQLTAESSSTVNEMSSDGFSIDEATDNLALSQEVN
jgi:hypothetical protein